MGSLLNASVTVNGRMYTWPQEPLIVVCLDGSSSEYLHKAIAAGAAPFFQTLVMRGLIQTADAAMPTFTNPNNVSIVTGVPPAVHGISGNFFLDRTTGQPVMMNSASLLRAETILAAFSRAGAKVVSITAKDKLRGLLSAGLIGFCTSAEREGVSVYSAGLSQHVLRRGIDCLQSMEPDLMYLSTSDYVQHAHAPGSAEANDFYGTVDMHLAELNRLGAALVITADHGMESKTDRIGTPNIVFLQEALDNAFGGGSTVVILPITDPYVAHHGSLGSFATVYLKGSRISSDVIACIRAINGVDLVLASNDARDRFELPQDRIGDIVVCADRRTVIGMTRRDHDLSVLGGPLRSHGGLAEREVPILFNRTLRAPARQARLRNYDAFAIGLNGLNSVRRDA